MITYAIISTFWAVVSSAYCAWLLLMNGKLSEELDELEGISSPEMDMEGLAVIAERLRREGNE